MKVLHSSDGRPYVVPSFDLSEPQPVKRVGSPIVPEHTGLEVVSPKPERSYEADCSAVNNLITTNETGIAA
jgi:hypothetical protein